MVESNVRLERHDPPWICFLHPPFFILHEGALGLTFFALLESSLGGRLVVMELVLGEIEYKLFISFSGA